MPTQGKVLVTGGAGFIGSTLVERLGGEGRDVCILDNFATGRRENLPDGAELIEGDVRSYERAHTAVRDCELVFHLAALPSVPRSVQDPLTSHAVNATGTLNVLSAARDEGVRRVVFASSSSVYGACPELPMRETTAPAPISPYAVAKLAAEGYCRAFTEVYGLETVALRYFNVFGPRQDPGSQYSAVVPRFVDAVLDGGRPVIFGDGEQSRDFTYVGDAIEATVRASEAEGASGSAFNVACGRATTVNGLLADLAGITGRDAEPRHEPARAGELEHSLADVSAARETLGFEPAVSLGEGLRHTVEWHRRAAQP